MQTFYLHNEILKTGEAIQDRNRKYRKQLVQLRTRREQDEKVIKKTILRSRL
jgi:hypothetical protein